MPSSYWANVYVYICVRSCILLYINIHLYIYFYHEQLNGVPSFKIGYANHINHIQFIEPLPFIDVNCIETLHRIKIVRNVCERVSKAKTTYTHTKKKLIYPLHSFLFLLFASRHIFHARKTLYCYIIPLFMHTHRHMVADFTIAFHKISLTHLSLSLSRTILSYSFYHSVLTPLLSHFIEFSPIFEMFNVVAFVFFPLASIKPLL